MNFSTPASHYDKQYYRPQSSVRASPNKPYPDQGYEEIGTVTNAFRNFQLGATTVSEDETQINGILNGLKNKLGEIEDQIAQKEDEKAGIIEDINVLTQRLKALAKSIVKKKNLYDSYDKIVNDAENALGKITESTKTLLHVVKKENGSLNKLTYSAKK